MHLVDPSQIISGLLTMAIGAAATWFGVHLIRFAKDLNAAFSKIRRLEKEVFGDESD